MTTAAQPLDQAVSRFGASLKAKLSGKGAAGAPEDQLRAPLEALIADLAGIALFKPGDVVAVGEASLTALKTRPDYAVKVKNALVGFIEVKAPGKGADPRRFRDEHDRGQWDKLKSLPNLVYTDGNAFSLWRDGKLQGEVIRLQGDVETAGAKLGAPAGLGRLFADFLRWEPIPPTTPRGLAEVSAGLCRLLRDEVTEQLALATPALTGLADDWRRLLVPEASNEQFADGYAQAVTFGLLMARAQGIALADGFDRVAKSLAKTNTVIGSAFRVLTDDVDGQEALKTSLGTLTRVMDGVDWAAIGKGDPDAWLYFYEHFLEAYDNALRKQTGSYYTPPEVVTAMVRLVDEALRDPARFGVAEGLASAEVTLADPAAGTGTYLLGVLRRIAETAKADQGAGAVPGVIRDALKRIIGFELQFGPFAVAQLRLLAEVADLLKVKGTVPGGVRTRLYVTNTLGNPDEEQEYIPSILKPLADSRRQANAIKRAEPITVVIGNPPYKEKAKGRGGWVESGSASTKAPLQRWMPPSDFLAYIAAVAAHPAYTSRFAPDLVQPGLRIPLTADPALFAEAAVLGREVIWLHTFGERFADPQAGRPAGAPRLPDAERPHIPEAGAIPGTEDAMPETITYNPVARRLQLGAGYVDNVTPEVWAYEVSGKQVLTQWFSYRGRDRSRPIIGDRRPPSPLGDIQPAGWLAEYTTELLNVLNVLGRLVKLETRQADLLSRICSGLTIPAEPTVDITPVTKKAGKRKNEKQGELIG